MISVLETNGKHGAVVVNMEKWRITLRTMNRALQTQWFPNFGIKYQCVFVTEHSSTGTVTVKTRT